MAYRSGDEGAFVLYSETRKKKGGEEEGDLKAEEGKGVDERMGADGAANVVVEPRGENGEEEGGKGGDLESKAVDVDVEPKSDAVDAATATEEKKQPGELENEDKTRELAERVLDRMAKDSGELGKLTFKEGVIVDVRKATGEFFFCFHSNNAM